MSSNSYSRVNKYYNPAMRSSKSVNLFYDYRLNLPPISLITIKYRRSISMIQALDEGKVC